MWKETYQTLFICVSSFYTIEHWLLVESQLINEETVKTTRLAKKSLLGNEVEEHLSGMMTPFAIAGITLGIGITAQPNELSLREINSTEQLYIPSICEKTNGVTVFGMHPGEDCSNEGETKAMMDKSHIDYENEHDGSSSRRSNTDNENESETESDLMGDYELHSYLNPEHFTEHDVDMNMESEIQPLKLDNANFSVLVTEPNRNHENEMQSREIDTPRRTVRSVYGYLDLKARWNSMTAIKKRRIKSAAVVGTVAVLIIALTTVAIKMTNKTDMTEQDELENILTTTDNMIEQDELEKGLKTTDNMIEQDELKKGLTTTDNMIEQDELEKSLTDREITLATQICLQYQYNNTACQGKNITSKCYQNVYSCMTGDSELQLSPNMNCQMYQDVTDLQNRQIQTSMRKIFLLRFFAVLNKGMKPVGNISSLKCTFLSNGFRKSIQDMASSFKCNNNEDFEKTMLDKSLKACEMLRDGNMTTSHMCLIHTNMNAYEDHIVGFFPWVAGAADPELQSGLEECTRQYDTNFHDQYFPSHEGSGKN